MACMCGDTHCPSCGPAQGNSRCLICGAWMDDCCEHYDEDTGELKPEFQAQYDAAVEVERAADEGVYQDWLRSQQPDDGEGGEP